MKKLATLCLAACLAAALATPAGALDYAIDAPEGPDYGKPTSVEVVHTADGGALKNEDISKNAALIPPGFGSASADTLNTGTWLTPNLAPEGMAVGAVNGSGMPVVFPPSVDTFTAVPAEPEQETESGGTLGYTPVASDLYYSGGYLGTLKIPAIGLSVRVYEGTDSSTLMKGAGHFKGTSIWDGNCAFPIAQTQASWYVISPGSGHSPRFPRSVPIRANTVFGQRIIAISSPRMSAAFFRNGAVNVLVIHSMDFGPRIRTLPAESA